MKFTFGIVTSPGSCNFLQQITDSICNEQIPDFEIIIVGGQVLYDTSIMRVFPFDETKKQMWITRKKNIITENARYENIVYLHDYVSLVEGWYKGFLKFGNEFDICMTQMQNADGTRFRDWNIWRDHGDPRENDLDRLLPYDVTNLSKIMYISGAYWVAKRDVMKKFPLDESLSWGEGEDVKWSKQVREHYQFSINPHSKVQLLKQKDKIFGDISPSKLKEIQDETLRLEKL